MTPSHYHGRNRREGEVDIDLEALFTDNITLQFSLPFTPPQCNSMFWSNIWIFNNKSKCIDKVLVKVLVLVYICISTYLFIVKLQSSWKIMKKLSSSQISSHGNRVMIQRKGKIAFFWTLEPKNLTLDFRIWGKSFEEKIIVQNVCLLENLMVGYAISNPCILLIMVALEL